MKSGDILEKEELHMFALHAIKRMFGSVIKNNNIIFLINAFR